MPPTLMYQVAQPLILKIPPSPAWRFRGMYVISPALFVPENWCALQGIKNCLVSFGMVWYHVFVSTPTATGLLQQVAAQIGSPLVQRHTKGAEPLKGDRHCSGTPHRNVAAGFKGRNPPCIFAHSKAVLHASQQSSGYCFAYARPGSATTVGQYSHCRSNARQYGLVCAPVTLG